MTQRTSPFGPRVGLAALLLALRAGAQDCPSVAAIEPLGGGTRGSAGAPELAVLGLPALDQPGVGLRVQHGAPFAAAQIVVSLTAGPKSLLAYGATLWPAAPALRWTTTLDAHGASPPLDSGPAPLPASFCGLDVFVQGLVIDAAAQGGAAFTSGLRLHFGAGSTAAHLFPLPTWDVVPGQVLQARPEIVAGDLDGDGRPDLVVPAGLSSVSASLRVFRQLGDGTLAASPPFPLMLAADDLDLADVDGDGQLDVVALAGSFGAPALAVMPGQGNGTFGSPQLTTAPAGFPLALAAGDVTGDGRVDVVVTDWLPETVALLQGAPTSGFLAPQLVPVTGLPAVQRVRLAEMDGDGLPDVVLAGEGPAGLLVALLRSQGAMGLTSARTWALPGDDLQSFDVGDVDGDAHPDVAAAVFQPLAGGQNVEVLRGDGAGGFLPAVATESPDDFAQDLCLADLDGDGSAEVLIAADFELWSLSHVGAGALAPAVSLGDDARRIAPADMDADGRLDLALLQANPFSYVGWRRGAGDGMLVGVPEIAGFPALVTRAADLDGDADIDLVGGLANAQIGIALHQPHMAFGPVTKLDAGGSVRRLVLADVDADGTIDVAIAHTGVPGLALLRGLGDGSFAPPVTGAAGFGGHDVRVGDLNADGLPELVVSDSGSGVLHVFEAPPGGGLAEVATSPAGATLERFALGDLDGDGTLDAIAQVFGNLILLRGTGGLGFAPPLLLPAPEITLQAKGMPIELGDVDADGDLDLVYVPGFTNTQLRLNDGSAALALAPFPWALIGDELAVVDVNGDGALDVVGNGACLGFGDGTFAAFQPGAVEGGTADLDGDGDVDVCGHGRLYLNSLYDG